MPVLDVLSSGDIMHYNDMRKRVRDQHYADLPEALLQQRTQSGDELILNRIGW